MMTKEKVKVWTFASGSNPNKKYETLQYADRTTSCNCPGWTRRVDPNGNRSCKHTRMVEQGIADEEAVASADLQSGQTAKPKIAPNQKAVPKQPKAKKAEKKIDPGIPVVRKIVW